jgi:AbrB family looped-hinge helix DNA binding protein
MVLGHITQTGNLSLPKQWRDELGIEPNSNVLIEKRNNTIIIEPLKKKKLSEAFKTIDNEIEKKNIQFTRKEAVRDDLYD